MPLDGAVQVRFPEVFTPLLRPARYKGAHGGRGSGKSRFFAQLAVLSLKQGRNVLCVREIQKSIADSVKLLIENTIEELGMAHEFETTENEIRCRTTGARCIFRGMQNHTAAQIKSLEDIDDAWIEEAQTISQRSLDLLIPTIRNEGSSIWASWNPNDETDPIDQLLRADPPETATVVCANWSDNPFFPDVLRADMERDRKRDPEKYAHVWAGGYETRSEVRVFKRWRVEALTPPPNVRWHYGADFGFSVDPNAGLRCAIWGDTLYVDQEVYEHGTATTALPGLFARIEGFKESPSYGDGARPETIDHLMREGFYMQPAKKGKDSVKDGVEFLRSYDIVCHPRCTNFERELQRYSYKVDKRTGEILADIEDRDNHLIDALRYATHKLWHRGERIHAETVTLQRAPDYDDHDEDEAEASWITQ